MEKHKHDLAVLCCQWYCLTETIGSKQEPYKNSQYANFTKWI